VGEPFLAVDVGGSSVKSAVVVDGEVTRYSKDPVAAGLDGLVAQLSRLYEGCGLAWGVCLPGLIDARTGTVHYSANLGMRDVAFLDELEAALPRPLVFENDLVAATVGEAAGGTLALLQLGTGIAARCAVDGAVPASAGGRAGEVGHLRFRDDGLPCACGRNGCVEAYAGWGGIRRRYEEAGREIASPAGVLRDAETDPWARELLDEALEAIGFAAAALVSAWDPGTLRLGGGVAAAWGETLRAAVREALAQRLLPKLAATTQVEGARLGDGAALLGLYRLARTTNSARMPSAR
jgi:glucokinase